MTSNVIEFPSGQVSDNDMKSLVEHYNLEDSIDLTILGLRLLVIEKMMGPFYVYDDDGNPSVVEIG
tara:strand:+ start:739 stop:936 length:198 start_codon:yes stop_codon:yes gene_type:complete